jgi:DNA mismatch repair ATPase MutS
MGDRNNDDVLTEEQVDAASRPVAAIQYVEKDGQKQVSFVLRRASHSTPRGGGADAATAAPESSSSSSSSSPEGYSCKVKDTLRWEFAWCSVLDDNNFSMLATLVNEHAPGVVYIPDSLMAAAAAHRAAKKVLAALTTCEVVAKPAAHFKAGAGDATLLRLTGKASIAFMSEALEQAPGALACIACLARHEVPRDGLESGSLDGSHRMLALDSASHMKLDHSAVAALHLFPASRTEDRFHSLFGMLNACKTKKIGARLLERWIRQPLTSVAAISARQDLVQAFVREQLVRQNLRDEHLVGVPDLQRIVGKFDKGKAALQDVYLFYTFCQTLQPILALLAEVDQGDDAAAALKEAFVDPLAQMVTQLKPFLSMVHLVLDFDAVDRIPPVYEINPNCEMAQQYGAFVCFGRRGFRGERGGGGIVVFRRALSARGVP